MDRPTHNRLAKTILVSTNNRGSYKCAHVLLNLLNESGEKDKMPGCAEHLISFPQRV